ncbi:MAG: enoyl-CoA hydratase [Deltaproteobacteria bacterium]|nr:enoyl-CoA hydratase [Deltaproteobacteria bacterium]
MDYQEIIVETEASICTITLNKPEKINALSKNMVAELIHAFTAVSEDETVKVVILKAAGKHFCAGHFMAEMVDGDMKTYKFIFDQCTRLMTLIHEIPQVVIAQVQGVATAAGCQLVAWSDLAVAEDGARFATPGVKIGLFCTTPMVALTRAIGRKAAMEMLMTGRYFPAAEAKELGLVNKVVPIEQLADETRNLAAQIVEASGLVIGIGKQAFYAQVDQTDAAAWNYAKHTITLNNLAQDAQNGIKAFLKKETPEWENR